MADVVVRDNPERSRFEVLVDGEAAGFAAYRLRDGAVVLTHTEIDSAHQGEGLGLQLARQTLDQLRERDARVVPSCPFFAAYIDKHPEYRDMTE